MRLARGTVLLGAAIAACAAWLAVYASRDLPRAADQVMRREVDRGHFSGTAFISRNGRVLFVKAYGLANVAGTTANTVDTKFRIGSITKTFTATLILQLEQQRKLALTDSVCSYLDSCPDSWRAITLHHLLSHTSGIFNITLAPDFDQQIAMPQTRDSIIARMRAKPPAFAPGEKFQYSNSNFYLLGLVIEKVTGRSYESVLRSQILDPLGMSNTGIIHDHALPTLLAIGYRPHKSGSLVVDTPMDESWSHGDGGMYSTVGDLAKWSQALDTDAVLTRATLQRMWQPVKDDYGYGWELPSIAVGDHTQRIIQHAGLVPGFPTVFQKIPVAGLTVIVLANTLSSDPRRAAQSLRALILGEHFVPTFDRDSMAFTPEMLQRLVGQYELGGEIFTLSAHEGRLFVTGHSHPDIPPWEILAESASVLYLKGDDGELAVTLGSRGEVSGFLLLQGTNSRTVRKIR